MRTGTFRSRSRLVALALTAAIAVVVPAVGATAGRAGTSASFCRAIASPARAFLPWGDQSLYVLAPDGGLEAGGAGWTLAGGASVKPGNESFYVHGSSDGKLLDLPSGATATTPALCIDSTMPTARFFVSGYGANAGKLSVDAFYTDASGASGWRHLDNVNKAGAWAPSAAFKLPKGIQSPSVQFRFTVTGGGGFRIDDLYVDPYIRV
jgi:hypothetical protein